MPLGHVETVSRSVHHLQVPGGGHGHPVNPNGSSPFLVPVTSDPFWKKVRKVIGNNKDIVCVFIVCLMLIGALVFVAIWLHNEHLGPQET